MWCWTCRTMNLVARSQRAALVLVKNWTYLDICDAMPRPWTEVPDPIHSTATRSAPPLGPQGRTETDKSPTTSTTKKIEKIVYLLLLSQLLLLLTPSLRMQIQRLLSMFRIKQKGLPPEEHDSFTHVTPATNTKAISNTNSTHLIKGCDLLPLKAFTSRPKTGKRKCHAMKKRHIAADATAAQKQTEV